MATAAHTEFPWATLIAVAAAARAEMRLAWRSRASWIFLGLGLANLLAGLALGVGHWVPTFALLDVVYANFGVAVWAAVIAQSGPPPLAAGGIGLVTKTTALALVGAAMLTVAGLACIVVQLRHGHWPLDLGLYVEGLYANFGWSTLHLAMLAVAVRALVGRNWPAMLATTAVWMGSNLGFEHLLARFGAPIGPPSDMNGYGPFLYPRIAAGIHWTGLCIVLLAAGHWIGGRRASTTARPPSLHPNAFALVWAGAVAWIVSGGWIFHQVHVVSASQAPVAWSEMAAEEPSRVPDRPQPEYARLDLAVDIRPTERRLTSRGFAIAVNRLEVAIPELHFTLPRASTLNTLSLTGELVEKGPQYRRYRLNRPLEPGETLKIEFDLAWTRDPFDSPGEALRLLANGTTASSAELVPAIASGPANRSFHAASPVVFRALVSTSPDQVVVAPGALVGEWRENARRFFDYRAERPIPLFATIHSGRYAVARESWNDIAIEIFHHPPHHRLVARMIDAAKATLEGWSESSPYPYDHLRMVEIPDHRPLRRFGFLGFNSYREAVASPIGKAPPDQPVIAIWPYSERGILVDRSAQPWRVR